MYDLKSTPMLSLVMSSFGLFMGFSTVALFGTTAPMIKANMGLTPEEVGLLVAIPTLTGGLFRVLFGAWADSNGGKKPMLILLCLTTIGLGLFSILASSVALVGASKSLYPLLLLCGALTGCGIGAFTVGIANVSYWFKKNEQGSMLGLYGGIGGISSGLITILIPIGLTAVGFANVYHIWFFFLLASVVLYFLFGDNSYYFQLVKQGKSVEEAKSIAKSMGMETFPKGNAWVSITTAIKKIRCWALSLVYFSTFGGSLALTSWLPMFYTAHYGKTLVTAGLLTGFSSMLSPIMRVVGGKLADRYSGELISLIALIICLSGSVVLTFSDEFILSTVAIFSIVTGIGLSNGSIFKLVPIYIEGAVGGASGIIGGVGALGGFVIPPILGYMVTLMGENGYARGFLFYIILFTLCIITMQILRKHKPQL